MHIHFFVILTCLAGVAGGCKTHRLPALPPERDPTSESAPVTPYRAPPDVLSTELSKGAPAGGGHEHMHHGPAPAETKTEPAPADPKHEGHDGHATGGEP